MGSMRPLKDIKNEISLIKRNIPEFMIYESDNRKAGDRGGAHYWAEEIKKGKLRLSNLESEVGARSRKK